MVANYIKEGTTTAAIIGFIDGMNAIVTLINKNHEL
jgi:hypothetical protein